MSVRQEKLFIAANNGDIGGGEVMLFAIAEAARELGKRAVIAAPSSPDPVLFEARKRGFETIELSSRSRLNYMVELRKWWRKTGANSLLWCNGLLPAVATGGLRHRIVHLHQVPSGRLKFILPFARFGASVILVPSTHMKDAIEGSELFPNWSDGVDISEKAEKSQPKLRVGFIGRFSSDKGLLTLIEAMNRAVGLIPSSARLVLAGEPKFIGSDDQERIREAIDTSLVPIEQHGWVKPAQFFSSIDLAVVPSIWPEAFGLVATECMSARVPLIVSDAGALPEIVGPDYPWIFKAGDSQSLLDGILGVTAAPTIQKNLIVNSAFKRWESLYSPVSGRESVKKILQRFERE